MDSKYNGTRFRSYLENKNCYVSILESIIMLYYVSFFRQRFIYVEIPNLSNLNIWIKY